MRLIRLLMWFVGTLCVSPAASAQSYEADIGYNALQSLLGTSLPSGAGVPVIHTEASLVATSAANFPVYAPDTTNASFAGKVFSFPGTASTAASAHATAVGQIFYGLGEPGYGIGNITVYEADGWLNDIFTATASAPAGASRVSNNSWVGSTGIVSEDATLLREIDRLTALYELVQVFAMPYGAGNALGAGAFNVIAVGETAVGNFIGSDAIDSLYVSGRTRPDLVVAETYTSDAAPATAAAAALLVQTGHAGALTLSRGSATVKGIGTVYDAERAITVRAVLMAGASRATNNTSTTANVSGYASGAYASANGLDTRYGAGQLDILTSYQILAAGEQRGSASAGSSGAIGARGFDYLGAFGGSGASATGNVYRFTASANAQLAATLVWNLQVSNDSSLTATLYALSLSLTDTTTGMSVATSASAHDNTQTVWAALVQGHAYQLQVGAGGATPFATAYALAWNSTPIPQVSASATTVGTGGAAVLTVTPVGSGPFTYQWYLGASGNTASPVAGATGSTVTTPSLTAGTSYWVQVTSAGGVYNSATIAISVAGTSTDAPLPPWAAGLLGLGLLGGLARRSGRH